MPDQSTARGWAFLTHEGENTSSSRTSGLLRNSVMLEGALLFGKMC